MTLIGSLTENVQSPWVLLDVLPSEWPSIKSSMTLFGSAVPLNVGVMDAVMLSESELPVSLTACRTGVDGGAVPAIVELLDTGVLVSEATSLPEGFWVALVSLSEVGSV